jgi:hypothetical protein
MRLLLVCDGRWSGIWLSPSLPAPQTGLGGSRAGRRRHDARRLDRRCMDLHRIIPAAATSAHTSTDPTLDHAAYPRASLHSLQHARPHLAAIARRCCPRSRRCCSRRSLASARCAIATPRLGSPVGSHAVILSRPNVSHNRRAPMPSMPTSLIVAMTPSCCTGLRRSIRTEHPRRIRF